MNRDSNSLNFKLVNRITGWIIFAIATLTYVLTAEPTISLWDCGEFITTSAGLQVGHPPGAPLFMIISRLFAIFAPSAETQAVAINYMSGVCSGLTVLFLFWSISHLARKLVIKAEETMNLGQLCAIMAASIIGSLAYAFSDTFWFSAVEGEVYAMSSLFTALVFWAILKWENVADEPYSNRWLVLIAFMIGLSIGVHLLNLLAIPAIVFVYYFRKYTPTKNGIIKTSLISLVILGFVNFLFIPGFIKIACWFELLFVNGMNLPFNTGVIIYAIGVIMLLTFGIYMTYKKQMPILNTILTCFVVMIIGYSSYAMVVIRSLNNPPIDENSPDNVFSLLAYINRDQYGDKPLFYGQYYNAPLLEVKDGEPIYYQNKLTGKYENIGTKSEVEYDKRFMTFFPRMHSSTRGSNETMYQVWGGKNNGPTYTIDDKSVTVPSFANNMRFFFNYQVDFMYWRYFMWNFSGRQNDIQGHGNNIHGNWITGIKFLDEIRLGNMDKYPSYLEDNKANNKYYMLPFLLGLLGVFFQYTRSKQGKMDFWTVMLLFFMTGLAIIIFLNQAPMEPRERDYAYAGSFYAFSIWIGLGVLGVWDMFDKVIKNKLLSAVVVGSVLLIIVPVNMAAENWDDHSRAGRYATIAHAKNYLNSCEENAILFTYGDNDTFPLWYAQEVEGIRRDIRIVNLSLLQGAWYIDQMKHKAYETDGVPLTMEHEQYRDGKREQIIVADRVKDANMKDAVGFVLSDLPQTKRIQGMRLGDKDEIVHIPSRELYIPVDSAKVIASGMIKPEDADRIVKDVRIKLSGNWITKSDLAMFDLISNNNWERPIYFGVGMGNDSYKGFQKYFRLEGAVYRLVPIASEGDSYEHGIIDTDILYDNVMNKFEWGNIKDPSVNIDYFHDFTISVMKYRSTFLRLATALYEEGKSEKAKAVLDKCLEELPISQVDIDNVLIYYIPLYYQLGDKDSADMLLNALGDRSLETLKYVSSLSEDLQMSLVSEAKMSSSVLKELLNIADAVGNNEFRERIVSQYK